MTSTLDNNDSTSASVNHGRVQDIDLGKRMSTAYLDYAMSVIVGRALPDVRDGLKPVHRRVLYAMYDGGYRPDRGYYKCARIVGDVMGNYHPHGDTAIYDTLVRMAQPWSMRHTLVDGNGNFGSRGDDPAAAFRYTEAKLAPLAMEMARDIDQDTVDFRPNYDGRSQEPVVLPARYPNLLVNGAGGIAVGMATNIPTHNLREVGDAALWHLAHPDASEDELLDATIERVSGPDFPTAGLIVGRAGIRDAYRTGRGSIRMRAVVEIVEDNRGRTQIVVTELPYQVNPDSMLRKIKELVDSGTVTGIADFNDEGSARVGLRLVITLKRDAVAKVVLNNLYKHTQLQHSFGVNMVSLVDGRPQTLNIGQMVRYWAEHQMEVVTRRAEFQLAKAQERDHILQGLLAALDQLDAVITLIRASESAEAARSGLMQLLSIDEMQTSAILDMQLRRLAALERQRLLDEHNDLAHKIADLQDLIASPQRKRDLIATELTEIVEKYSNDRLTTITAFEGDLTDEDLIPREDMVVTITRGGYTKRTRTDQYRAQKRGGKGVRGATLRNDDIVEHFFVTSTHSTIMFFTNQGRIYRSKAYELAEGGRDAKGQHIANVLGFQPGETIASVLDISDYQAAPYLVLATRKGLVKKTPLSEYDTRMSGGLIAVNLRDGDELVSASLVSADDDLLLVSRQGQAVRFNCTDEQVRPMSRNTSGVTGMRFRDDDSLMSALVISSDETGEVLVATSGGYAKRTPVKDYPTRGRGGLGVMVAKTGEDRGEVIAALIVDDTTEVFALTAMGGVIRTRVGDVRVTARSTMGVKLMNLAKNDAVLTLARNTEPVEDDEEEAEDLPAEDTDTTVEVAAAVES